MNISATLNALRLIYNPKLCRPQLTIGTFNELPVPVGPHIKAIVLDKDNCFAYPYENNVWPEYSSKWEDLKKEYPDNRLLIVSNSAGSSDDIGYKEASMLEKTTGVPVLRHTVKKPGCGKEILEHFYGKNIIDHPSQIAVVGDRLFTDMIMANSMGSRGIWVKEGVKLSTSLI